MQNCPTKPTILDRKIAKRQNGPTKPINFDRKNAKMQNCPTKLSNLERKNEKRQNCPTKQNNLNSEIKFAILKKAALLEKDDMKKEKVKRGTYKVPGSNEGRTKKKTK